MPVVLDNDPGERVLLYGTDGASLLKVLTDSSGRLVVVVNSTTGTVTVTATDLDIRNLVKTQDEIYAVLRTDAGVAYDARTRSWTITETVPVTATDLDIRNLVKTQDEVYAVLRTDAGAAYDARGILGNDGTTDRRLLTTSAGLLRQTRHYTQLLTQTYEATPAPHGVTSRWTYTVPSGHIAFIEGVYLMAQGTTAAAQVACLMRIARSGGGQLRFAHVVSVVGTFAIVNGSYDLALAAGDVLEGLTVNSDGVAREVIINAYLREITL